MTQRFDRRTALGIIVSLCMSAPAAAGDEVLIPECGAGGEPTVHVSNMGMVTAEHLREHMDKMKEDLDRARRMEAPSSAHRKVLEKHVQDMEKAMEALQAAITQRNCPPGAVPMEARIENLERRLDALQKLLDQVIGHQREADRNGR